MDWDKFANAIAQLALVALRWYYVVEGGQGEFLKDRQRRVARVLDPDTPETTVEEVRQNGG